MIEELDPMDVSIGDDELPPNFERARAMQRGPERYKINRLVPEHSFASRMQFAVAKKNRGKPIHFKPVVEEK